MKRGCVALMLLLTAATSAASQQKASTNNLLVLADSLSRAGRFEAAERAYTQLINLGPNAIPREMRADAYFGRAYTNHLRFNPGLQGPEPVARERIIEMQRDYRMATALDSAVYAAPSANNIGMLLLLTGAARPAVAQFLSAAATNHPNRGRFFANAGEAFEDLGVADSAIWAYQRALAFPATAEVAASRLAGLYALAGLADSVLAVAKATRFKIEHSLYKESLLKILSTPPALPSEKADSIFMLFARDLATDSVIDPAHFSRTLGYRLDRVASLYPSLKPPAAAIRGITRPLVENQAFNPPSDTWWRTQTRRYVWSNLLRIVGDHYRWSGRYAQAGAFFDAAVDFEAATGIPLDFNIIGAAIEAHSQNSNVERVERFVALLEALLREQPNPNATQRRITRNAYFEAAVAMSGTRRWLRSLELNRRALQLDPAFAIAMVNAGYVFQVLQEVDSARSYFESAVAIDPNESVGRNNLGFATFMSGDFTGAIPHLDASYSLQPSLLTAINLGLAYRFSGQLQRARTWHQLADSIARIATSTTEPYSRGTWVYNYTPPRAGDRVTIRNNILVGSLQEKRAVARFALGLDLGLLGDTLRGSRMLRESTQLALSPEYRCFFANDIAAALHYLRASPAIVAWLERERIWLRSNANCRT